MTYAGGVASFCLRTKRHLSRLSLRPSLPKMLILGDRDQFSSIESLEKMFTMQSGTTRHVVNMTTPTQPHAAHIELMSDCDHFFSKHRAELAGKVVHFCLEHAQPNQRATQWAGSVAAPDAPM